MGAPSSGAVAGSTAWTQPTATTTTASDNDHHLIPHADGYVTYVSLIQQYLSVFQIDNALWLAERCIADYPLCYDAIYLQALCYYRMGKIKNARACLNHRQYTTTGNENVARSGSNSVSSHSSTLSSMLFLSAQCSFELGDYISAETTLLQNTRTMYKQQQTRDSMGISMDDWILQSTPCPIPNGAAGLALLGKICRKSSRKDRAAQYFRMSLQLDPFLFTSFQALSELGETNLDASAIFGGTVMKNRTNHYSNLPTYQQKAGGGISDTETMFMKTPLQLMTTTPMPLSTNSVVPRMGGRAIGFETPDLTPITRNNNESFGLLNNHRTTMTPATKNIATTATTSSWTTSQPPLPNDTNLSVVRRAKQIAGRLYYPPSPDTSTASATSTPVTSVTRSMRYLRGLGTIDGNGVASGRSLFHTTVSENEVANHGFIPSMTTMKNSNVNNKTTGTGIRNASTGDVTNLKPEKLGTDEAVKDILDILTISGDAYFHLCQYRCHDAVQLFQQLPIAQQRTPWVLHQQGRAFLEQGDFFSAQRCFEYMHSVDPGRMQGLELLSTVYWQLKKEVDLANLAQRTMDWDFQSPQAHCVAGNCFSLQKDHETALVFFRRSLQLDPNFTYTHTLSGYEYMANEDFTKATACFRRALQNDDRHYNAWYGLGMIYHRQEKYDLAEYHFERAVKIHPTSGVLRCNLGMAQNANGKAYVALETLSEAFRLDPRNPQARFQRATIYSSLHRPEEALMELKIVRDAAPREATVHFAMGKILKRLGRLDEAMKCFLTAMDLDPKDNQLIKSAMDKLGEPDGDDEGTTSY